MKVPSLTSPRNSDIPDGRRWVPWVAAVPAVVAGCVAAWMFDWTAGITTANGVLGIVGQLTKPRKSD